MFGEQLGGVFSSVSLSERWRLIISYLTEQWIAASLLTSLCQVNVLFFKWWREGRGGGGGVGVGGILLTEMMISHLTLRCCLPTAETSRKEVITLPKRQWMNGYQVMYFICTAQVSGLFFPVNSAWQTGQVCAWCLKRWSENKGLLSHELEPSAST